MNYNFLNVIVAIALSVGVITGWRYLYEKPRLERIAEETRIYEQQIEQRKKVTVANTQNQIVDRHESIVSGGRVHIKSDLLAGSISLKGLRFDDLTLLKYNKTLDQNSEPVELFSPINTASAYFTEMGWVSKDKSDLLPNSSTIWSADKDSISPNEKLTLSWLNPNNVLFQLVVSFNEDYLFTFEQKVINNSNHPLSLQAYGLVNRIYNEPAERMVNILHQGMIGDVGGELKEFSYDKIKDNKREQFSKNTVEWIGITDKYWLAAFIPDKSLSYSSNFSYAVKAGKDKYQADFVSGATMIESGGQHSITHRLFAGAKKVDLLDKYEAAYDIELFDRAIDFGWFYVLTKPIFRLMNFFYGYVGNFGISIMIVTVLIKLALFSLANKSYRSMKKMKKLQPKMERLRELYSEDKARLNQEIMALYKSEKVNPVSGCLPLIIQIPVFFSIYKVLYVTIEMRHAPFFGWIQDLSAPDPTTIFNLFGLLPFTPPSFLMIGVWPLFMAFTMFWQQRMHPEPADPVQAKVVKFMPLMFLFMFSSFPAGLLIYWSWNNILSILQQNCINKLDRS